MNRIVIIGNGFDLAQGLKTSYEDFLLDYLKTEIKRKIEDPECESDKLFAVVQQYNDIRYFEENYLILKSLSDFKKNVPIYYPSGEYFAEFHPNENKISYHKHKRYLEIKTNSFFLNELLDKENWADIEKFYFEELTSRFLEHKSNKEQLKEDIINLNRDFEHLKLKLVEYLKKIEYSSEKLKFEGILRNSFKPAELNYYRKFFDKDSKSKEPINISNVVYLNFNYTNTLNRFFEKFEQPYKSQSIHCQIHGNINEPESIIFGYGDDASNSKYKELEDTDMRELLENFKSIHYPKTKHYNDLMNIIEAEPFDVLVLGHSMGLSDRVLLESIFENENCKAIRLFHRGSKRSFEDKVIAISRHFKNKQSMRRKIVFDEKDVLGVLK